MQEYEIKTNKYDKNVITQLIEIYICCEYLSLIIWEFALDFYFVEDGHIIFLNEKLYLRLHAMKSCLDCLQICKTFIYNPKTIWKHIFAFDFRASSQQGVNIGSLKQKMEFIENGDHFYFDKNMWYTGDQSEENIQKLHDNTIADEKNKVCKRIRYIERAIDLYVEDCSNKGCDWIIQAFIQGDSKFLCQVYVAPDQE